MVSDAPAATPFVPPLDRRAADLRRLADEQWDLLIVGGGIVGVGSLLDAASRGLRVALVEQDDIASGTSSRSSRLIHGGLRYLQQLHVGLVREALDERARLLRLAPHLVRLESFLFPLYGLPILTRAFYGTGMTMYDVLGSAKSGGRHRQLSTASTLEYAPDLRRSGLRGGLVYHDAMEDDARFALAVARTAVEHAAGAAVVVTRVRATAAIRDGDRVAGAMLRDVVTGATFDARASAVLDATGVWGSMPDRPFGAGSFSVLPSLGSHLVVPRERIPARGGMTLRIPGRVAFLIPWPRHWLIGTTDKPYRRPGRPAVGERRGHRRAPRDGQRGPGPDALARRHRWHVRRAAAPGRAVGRGIDGQGLPRAPGRGRGRAASSGSAAASTRRIGSWPRRGRCRPRAPKPGAVRARRRSCRSSAPRLARTWMRWRPGSRPRAPIAGGRDVARRPAWDGGRASARGAAAGRPLVDGFPYLEAEVAWAADQELAMSLDDVLVRRMRLAQELPDRGAAIAPRVASLLGAELGWDAGARGTEVAALPRRRPPPSSTSRHDRAPPTTASSSHSTRAPPRRARSCSTTRGRSSRRAAASSRSTSPRPAMSTHDPEDIWSSQLAAAREVIGAGRRRRGHRRHRHHEPARDDRRLGARDRAGRSRHAIVWQSRITAPSARRSARGATSRSSANGPACRSTPTSRAPRSAHILDAGPALACARRARRARVRHRRHVRCSGA